MAQGHTGEATGTDTALLLFRLGMAAVFVVSGYQKLTGLDGTTGFFDSLGIPAAGLFAVLVAVAEFFGGLGLLVGVLPRFSGAVLSIDMLVAILLVTWPNGGWDGSRLEVMLLLGGVAIAIAGAGRFTLPEMLDKPELDIESALLGKER